MENFQVFRKLQWETRQGFWWQTEMSGPPIHCMYFMTFCSLRLKIVEWDSWEWSRILLQPMACVLSFVSLHPTLNTIYICLFGCVIHPHHYSSSYQKGKSYLVSMFLWLLQGLFFEAFLNIFIFNIFLLLIVLQISPVHPLLSAPTYLPPHQNLHYPIVYVHGLLLTLFLH